MKKTVSKYGDGGGTKRRSTTVKVVKDTPNKISAVSTTTVNRKSGAPKKVVSKSYENNFDAKGQVIGGSDVLKIEKSKYDKSGKLKSTVTKGASTFQKGGSTGAQMKAKGMAMKAKGQELKRVGDNKKYFGKYLKTIGDAKKELGDYKKNFPMHAAVDKAILGEYQIKKGGDPLGFKKGGTTKMKDGGMMSKLKSKGQAIRKAGQNLKRAVTKRMQNGGMSGTTNTNTTQAQRLNMPTPTGAVDRMNAPTTQVQKLNMSRSASPADTMNTNTTKGPRLGSGPTPGYKKGGSKMKIGAPKPGSAKPGSRRSKGY
jgi:hypothetical protein